MQRNLSRRHSALGGSHFCAPFRFEDGDVVVVVVVAVVALGDLRFQRGIRANSLGTEATKPHLRAQEGLAKDNIFRVPESGSGNGIMAVWAFFVFNCYEEREMVSC
jgi:hypothetical protein